jgi:hypothetical protein
VIGKGGSGKSWAINTFNLGENSEYDVILHTEGEVPILYQANCLVKTGGPHFVKFIYVRQTYDAYCVALDKEFGGTVLTVKFMTA